MFNRIQVSFSVGISLIKTTKRKLSSDKTNDK